MLDSYPILLLLVLVNFYHFVTLFLNILKTDNLSY